MADLPIIQCDDNIYMRPIELSDTDNIVAWRNIERVRSNFIFRGSFTKEIHEQWMNTKVKNGEVIQYIIMQVEKPVGSVYYRDVSFVNRSAEFGIFIGDDKAIGIGIGKTATRGFLDFGFNKLNLHRISLRLLKENRRAFNLYKSVGFKEEGVFRDMVMIDGEYRDVVFMAILEGKSGLVYRKGVE